jgi:ribulose 1,5-bisphosphate carboxylase large subunit-like protein
MGIQAGATANRVALEAMVLAAQQQLAEQAVAVEAGPPTPGTST